MFNIINHKVNANQNHNDLTPHPSKSDLSGLGCSSMAECLPSMFKTLGLISRTDQKQMSIIKEIKDNKY